MNFSQLQMQLIFKFINLLLTVFCLFACSYVCLVFVFYVLFSFLTWDKCASEGAKKQQMKVSEWSMKFAWVQVTESEMSSGRSVLLFLKGWVNV